MNFFLLLGCSFSFLFSFQQETNNTVDMCRKEKKGEKRGSRGRNVEIIYTEIEYPIYPKIMNQKDQ